MRNNFMEAADFMIPRLHLQADKIHKAFSGIDLSGLSENRRMLAGDFPELNDSARKLSRSMLKIGLLPHEDNLSGLLRADFLPPEGS